MMKFGETFQSRINYWIQQLIDKTPPDQISGSGEEGLKGARVIEAAIKSAETRQVVEL